LKLKLRTAVIAGTVEANANGWTGGSIEISGQQGVALETAGRLSAQGVEGGTRRAEFSCWSSPESQANQCYASAGRGGQSRLLLHSGVDCNGARVTASGTQGGGSIAFLVMKAAC